MQNLDEKMGMYQIHIIDGISTVIKQLKSNLAKGFILNKDLTTTPCYVAKSGNFFAHGTTAKEAMRDAKLKEFDLMNYEEKIDAFKNKFKKDQKYSGQDFFNWHGILTRSCVFGREEFVKENKIDLENKYTIKEFVDICENTYGYETIKLLLEN